MRSRFHSLAEISSWHQTWQNVNVFHSDLLYLFGYLTHEHITLRYRDDVKEQFEYAPGPMQLMIDASSTDARVLGPLDVA